MGLDELLGRTSTLRVLRLGPSGALLAPEGTTAPGPPASAVALPRAELPEGVGEGDAVEAFVYLDPAGRPLATTRKPKLELGEVAFLRVAATTRFGAFVDWGLDRDLLVPFDEQTSELSAGQQHFFGLFRDTRGRLTGTMRVSEMLEAAEGQFRAGEWVEGEAWRKEPGLGVFVIVERAFVGLLPESEPHRLARGEAASFRVASVLPDGKIRLSLRGLASEELDADADALLAALARPGAPRVGDRSSPEQIRALFGLTKKAFKRAAGRLLKRGDAEIDEDGFLLVRRLRASRGA
ncbi:MAG TPA: S1-like domain-containing RNA-binding protein [Polyangiaceae bacterium]|nr:S1-like domain-containing RNA-binding protein [Polyangiaceae bacterium]